MNGDEIIAALGAARGLPKAALKAAAQQPDAIAPAVIACMARAASGIVPLPREESLLFYGLHVLAAARCTAAFPAFLNLMRLPPERLESLLGDALTQTGAAMALSLYDGDADAVLGFLAEPAPDSFAKWAFFQAIARLVCEGRAPRDAVLAFLARFQATAAATPDDPCWQGWADAMILLGQVDAIDAVVGRMNGFEIKPYSPAAIAKLRADMEAAAANPADLSRFAAQHIAPIDDAVAALDWVRDDPAEPDDEELTHLHWLADFLDSDEVPSTAMTMEELDGFMTGLALLPQPVPPAQYLPVVWNDPSGDQMRFESAEKEALVSRILIGYPAMIRAQLAAGQQIEPWLTNEDGTDWAQGFRQAMSLAPADWMRVTAHPLHKRLATDIAGIADGPPGTVDGYGSPVTHGRMTRRLGDLARDTYRVLRGLPVAVAMTDTTTGRAVKVGRNDPCPCGSGKKYKKCCGAVA